MSARHLYFRKFGRHTLLLFTTWSAWGCGLFYENSYQGSAYTLYSDRNEDFLSRVGEKVGRIYSGYQELFELPQESLGTTTIVLDGDDSDVLDYS